MCASQRSWVQAQAGILACGWSRARSPSFILDLMTHRHEHRETIREIRVRKHPTLAVPSLTFPSRAENPGSHPGSQGSESFFIPQRLKQRSKIKRNRLENNHGHGDLINRGSEEKNRGSTRYYGSKPVRKRNA